METRWKVQPDEGLCHSLGGWSSLFASSTGKHQLRAMRDRLEEFREGFSTEQLTALDDIFAVRWRYHSELEKCFWVNLGHS